MIFARRLFIYIFVWDMILIMIFRFHPNRTTGSKGAGDEPKKEKKSKFRTPSFLRKRKEKKEAASKEKADK